MIFEMLIIAFLMVVAIVLILLEIFMLPGITVAGVGGFLFAAGGLFYLSLIHISEPTRRS